MVTKTSSHEFPFWNDRPEDWLLGIEVKGNLPVVAGIKLWLHPDAAS